MRPPAQLLAIVVALSVVAPSTATPPTLEWSRQSETLALDGGRDVFADSLGNVYIAGWTSASGGSDTSDAFLSKYDASGMHLWTDQLGTGFPELGYGVSADSFGNAYITGSTQGDLDTGASIYNQDAFLAKYDASGGLLWTQQFGPNGRSSGSDVVVDSSGNVYVTGATGIRFPGDGDAFLSKFDSSGTLLWTEQLGTSGGEGGSGVSVDSLGNVYISGSTEGSLEGTNAGGKDAFVAKYDTSGTLLWVKQLGTSAYDVSSSVSTDSAGNAYVTGTTSGSFDGTTAEDGSTFLGKLDSSGALLWTKQYPFSTLHSGIGGSADSLGNIYVTGVGLSGSPFNAVTYLSKLDTAGELHWTVQTSSNSHDVGYGVSADSLGNVYIGGTTLGLDAFLMKFHEPGVVPEPSALLLALLGGIIAGSLTSRRRA